MRLWGETTLKALDKKRSGEEVIWVMFLGCEWSGWPTALTPNISFRCAKTSKQRQTRCSAQFLQSRLEFEVLQQLLGFWEESGIFLMV